MCPDKNNTPVLVDDVVWVPAIVVSIDGCVLRLQLNENNPLDEITTASSNVIKGEQSDRTGVVSGPS